MFNFCRPSSADAGGPSALPLYAPVAEDQAPCGCATAAPGAPEGARLLVGDDAPEPGEPHTQPGRIQAGIEAVYNALIPEVSSRDGHRRRRLLLCAPLAFALTLVASFAGLSLLACHGSGPCPLDIAYVSTEILPAFRPADATSRMSLEPLHFLAEKVVGKRHGHAHPPHKEEKGSELIETECGPAEPGVDYVTSHTYRFPDVPDMQTCCRTCQSMPECLVWTWVEKSNMVSGKGTECYVRGGVWHGKKTTLDTGEPLPVRLISGNATNWQKRRSNTTLDAFNYAAVHAAGRESFVCPALAEGLPAIARPAARAAPSSVAVMSYNLEWWKVFDQGHLGEVHFFTQTDGNSAVEVIKEKAPAHDLLAFQECIDVGWILERAGLAEEYIGHQGPEEVCFAYRKAVWEPLGHGFRYVSEDLKQGYWRRRGTQWIKLRHQASGQQVFFMNHHGPLPIGSGGSCGGKVTAQNLLTLASEKAAGDVIILAGDFNAAGTSETIQQLETRLTKAVTGDAYDGVDNVFINLGKGAVQKKEQLRYGGSDHGAVSVLLKL